MNLYESIFIVPPETASEQIDGFMEKIKQIITKQRGSVTGEDRWGRKRLSYPIRSYREGFYVFFTFTAESDAATDLERFFNVTDGIIRQQTIKIIPRKKIHIPRRPPVVVPAATEVSPTTAVAATKPA